MALRPSDVMAARETVEGIPELLHDQTVKERYFFRRAAGPGWPPRTLEPVDVAVRLSERWRATAMEQ